MVVILIELTKSLNKNIYRKGKGRRMITLSDPLILEKEKVGE